MHKNTFSFVAASVAFAQLASAGCPGYTVEVFKGPTCQFFSGFASASGIADNGAICGSYLDCAEIGHPIIWWPDGEVTELPVSNDGGIPHAPFDLNSAGEVVGRMSVPGLNPPDRAFLYSGGVTLNLGALPGHNFAQGIAINSRGAVVGSSSNTSIGPTTAFVWDKDTMSPLSLPYGANSVAEDISDTDSICGWMFDAFNTAHAFLYDPSTGTTLDLGGVLLGATGARALAVSNSGYICGHAIFPCGKLCNELKGFIWSNGKAQPLGILPGKIHARPQAINDWNVIVGYCDPPATAFVWRNGTMTALNDLVPPELNLDIRHAWDINNAGQIVAEAKRLGPWGPESVALRLTPIPSPIGDSDCDSDVDVDDLLSVINHWADASPKGSSALPPGDFDHDGIVELDDLSIVLDNWTF